MEIRDVLTNIKKYDAWDYKNYPLRKEEVDAIIENYKEPCEDCISRKDAINVIKRTVSTEQIKALKRLPSVQPKPKTGHWIMSDDGLYRPICDNCGAHPWKGYIPTVEEATEVFKYCPNCGADMRGNE